MLATAPAFILLKNAKSGGPRHFKVNQMFSKSINYSLRYRSAASKCIPQSPVALATGNLVSLRFLGGALFYALSATWVITIYLNFMFPSLAEGVYYYPDGSVSNSHKLFNRHELIAFTFLPVI